MLVGQPVQPLDGGVDQLGIGRERDVLGLHCGVDGDARQLPGAQRATVVRHPQRLGQQQLELIAQALAPVAQPRALVRELVLEELLAGKELEVRVVDPALADLLIRQPVDMLQEQQADHEARRHRRTALLGKQRRDLVVNPRPVELPRQLHQLVPAVDNLIQSRAVQVQFVARHDLLGAHRNPPRRH